MFRNLTSLNLFTLDEMTIFDKLRLAIKKKKITDPYVLRYLDVLFQDKTSDPDFELASKFFEETFEENWEDFFSSLDCLIVDQFPISEQLDELSRQISKIPPSSLFYKENIFIGSKREEETLHATYRGKKFLELTSSSRREEKSWIIKYLNKDENIIDLLNEVVSQELIRMLLDPTGSSLQPKTRRAYNKLTDESFIISEEVSFVPLDEFPPEDFIKCVRSQTITGLGRVAATALIIGDTDRHEENVGINRHNKLVTLDNSFPLYEPSSSPITARIIQNLPYVTNDGAFTPPNWFGLYSRGEDRDEENSLVTPDMSHQKNIRKEINETILHFIILPDSLIEKFVKAYIENQEDAARFIEIIQKRRNTFLIEATKNQDFCDYILSDGCTKEIDIYLEKLSQFKTMRKDLLLTAPIKNEIKDNFAKLQENVKLLPPSPPKNEDRAESSPPLLASRAVSEERHEPSVLMVPPRNAERFNFFNSLLTKIEVLPLTGQFPLIKKIFKT